MGSPDLISHSLTDDQKVMEQCRYSGDYYQEIGSSDSHLYSSLTDTNTDDYESIEEMKRDNELEWRVLSRLEGEMGEDWRIVNSMPRTKARNTVILQEKREAENTCKMEEKRREERQLSISCRREMSENKSLSLHPSCEQAINDKSFLENLWSKTGKDLYQARGGSDRLPAAYLRKQVTFGKLLVFPC